MIIMIVQIHSAYNVSQVSAKCFTHIESHNNPVIPQIFHQEKIRRTDKERETQTEQGFKPTLDSPVFHTTK